MFPIRMPETLHSAVCHAATMGWRPINSEVLLRLECSLRPSKWLLALITPSSVPTHAEQESSPVFTIRIPIPLLEELKNSANLNKRSVNAEIVFRLYGSFVKDENEA